jgi:hypothetical protein
MIGQRMLRPADVTPEIKAAQQTLHRLGAD